MVGTHCRRETLRNPDEQSLLEARRDTRIVADVNAGGDRWHVTTLHR
jgi:hypothetical protein